MTMFSVCIPFLQNEPFLRELLQSIETVANVEMEILVSQDAPVSNDLKQHFQERLPIRWLAGPNRGIAANWNNCIEHAEGEYIVLFHADDMVLPNYFDTIVRLQGLFPDSAAWFCNVNVIDGDGKEISNLKDRVKRAITPRSLNFLLTGDSGLAQLLFGCFIYCPTVCYRASTLKRYRFSVNSSMVLDLDLYARLLMDGESMVGTNTKGYNYRRHLDSESSVLTKTSTRFKEEIGLHNSLVESLRALDWKRAKRQAILKVTLRLHLSLELLKSLVHLDGQRAIVLVRLIIS